jgi:DNA-binding SARP family transcriptional activator
MSARFVKLRLLGESSAEIEGKPLGADTTHVFAAVLALGLAPQRRITRTRLAALLWPDAAPARQAERLRWLLSKLRRLGMPMSASSVDVSVSDADIELDVRVELARLISDDANARDHALDQMEAVLPQYAPDFSPSFLRWVEEQRDVISDELLTALVPLMTDARQRADWTLTDRIARAIRRVAPLHEEATLVLAEALCARGDKSHGVAVLDQYLESLGEATSDLRLQAELLRRRIRTATAAPVVSERAPTFVGRRDALRRIQRSMAEATEGRGSAMLVAGPAGIGKTRLLDEVASFARTLGATVVQSRWHAADASRPLSGLTDVIAKLLELRGAAGCDPSTLEQLSHLSALDPSSTVPSAIPVSPQAVSGNPDWLRPALLDLLSAVSDEQALVVMLDDFQWADGSVRPLWDTVIQFAENRRILWCFAARSESVESATGLFSVLARSLLHLEWLVSLDIGDSRLMVDDLVGRGSRTASDAVRRDLLERGGGIPLVLQNVVHHWQATGDLASIPNSLAALLGFQLRLLAPSARRTLQVAGLLGAFATLDRLARVLRLSRPEFVDALAQLENAGILTTDRVGATQGHVLWAEAAIAQLESSVARVLHGHIADDLEREMEIAPTLPLLWEIARHWGHSGQSHQELIALTRGAEHLVRNRLYAAAAEVYGRAFDKSQDAQEQLRFLRRRIGLWRSAGDYEEMLVDIDRHESLAAAMDPLYDKHNELEMFRYTAYSNTPPWNDYAREALKCVADTSLSDSHRLHARHNCMRMAALAHEDQILEAACGASVGLVPRSHEDFRQYLLSEFSYQEKVGDLRQSLAAARELYARERSHGDPYMMAWSAQIVGVMESFAGAIAEGRRIAMEAITIARENQLTMLLEAAHAQLISSSCGYDPPAVARRYVDAADAEPGLPRTFLTIVVIPVAKAMLAIDENRPEEAIRLWPSNDIPDFRADGLAVRLAAGMWGRRNPEDAAPLHALAAELKDHFSQRKRGMGWSAAVYAEYLDAFEGEARADEFIRHYMQNVRRELVPPEWRLTPYVARATAAVLNASVATPGQTQLARH